CPHSAQVLNGYPIAATDVQSQKVGMQFFAISKEVAHIDGACGSPKQTNDMEEGGKRKSPLRFRQSSSKDGLQDDAADKPDESKSLADAGQQFGAVEILRSPSGAVLRVQPSGESCACESGGKEQPWIQSM